MCPERTSRYKGAGGGQGLTSQPFGCDSLDLSGLGLSGPHSGRYSGSCGVQRAHSHEASVNSIHYNLQRQRSHIPREKVQGTQTKREGP